MKYDKIEDVLLEMGVPTHLLGFDYLEQAIALVLQEPELIRRVTKGLYPAVARQNGANAGQVERAMRHALDVAFLNGDPAAQSRYFKNTIPYSSGRPTVSQFISTIERALRRELGGTLA